MSGLFVNKLFIYGVLIGILTSCGSTRDTTSQIYAGSPLTPKVVLSPPPTVYQLRLDYRGEETMGVQYYRDQARARYRVWICGALLCDQRGVLLDPQLGNPAHAKRSGKAIFVIDPEARLWVTFDQRYGVTHHSSLVAGGPVVAAGEMVVARGQVISVSNESGHYHPDPDSVLVTLEVLRQMGADISRVERYVMRSGQQKARRQR